MSSPERREYTLEELIPFGGGKATQDANRAELARLRAIEAGAARQESVKAAARSAVSEDWETDLDWEIEVAAPVNRHLLAPRQARAILDVAGQLADLGMHPDTIFNLLEGERGRLMGRLGMLP